MNYFLGIPVHGFEPHTLTDSDLLTQIVTLSSIFHFIYDGDRRWDINPDTMHTNYGHLLCNEKLQPLIEEAAQRASAGSEECALFLDITDTILTSHNASPRSRDGFINNIDHICRNKMIKSRYDRQIIFGDVPAPDHTQPRRSSVRQPFLSPA